MVIEQPFTGKPLGTVPKCGPEDVTRRDRARPGRAGGVGEDELRRARATSSSATTTSCSTAGGAARPAPDRVRQGAPARVRGGARRRDRRALLREHGREAPQAAPPPRRAAAPDRGVGVPPPARRGRDHRALELPAHAVDQRRASGARRGQRRGAEARRPDAVHRAPRSRAARGGRATAGADAGRDRLGLRARLAHHRRHRLHHVHGQHQDRPHGCVSRPASSSRARRWSSAARTR